MPRLRSTCTALLLSDACALFVSFALAFFLRQLFGGELTLRLYAGLFSYLPLFILFYAVMRLYPGVFLSPAEELKRLTQAASLGFLFFAFFLFLGQQGTTYSRLFVLMAWFSTICLTPLFRFFTRSLCGEKEWWGYPVLVFALPDGTRAAAESFEGRRSKGLYVAETVMLALPGTEHDAKEGLWLDLSEDSRADAEKFLNELRAAHPGAVVLIQAEGMGRAVRHDLVLLAGRHFRRVLVQVDSGWLKQASLHVADIPGGQVLALRQNLLDPARMRMKRLLDVLLCLLGSVVFVPLIPLLGLWIKLDSAGPVFFVQERIGRHGKPIRVYKFRTMILNAQEVLDEVLANDPALRDEWDKDQKLTADPRLTKVGAFLRRTSLDELPQVINVIKGEMSLVGPRPIVEDEISRYGDAFDMYTRVKPGITGLWQVSGRNDVDYAKRVELDRRYVYNWSVWLDIYIIIRTVPALLSGKGAY